MPKAFSLVLLCVSLATWALQDAMAATLRDVENALEKDYTGLAQVRQKKRIGGGTTYEIKSNAETGRTVVLGKKIIATFTTTNDGEIDDEDYEELMDTVDDYAETVPEYQEFKRRRSATSVQEMKEKMEEKYPRGKFEFIEEELGGGAEVLSVTLESPSGRGVLLVNALELNEDGKLTRKQTEDLEKVVDGKFEEWGVPPEEPAPEPPEREEDPEENADIE